MRALSHIGSYTPGTILRAWLFTIMRNTFFTQQKKAQRERPGRRDCVSGTVISQPDHDRVLEASASWKPSTGFRITTARSCSWSSFWGRAIRTQRACAHRHRHGEEPREPCEEHADRDDRRKQPGRFSLISWRWPTAVRAEGHSWDPAGNQQDELLPCDVGRRQDHPGNRAKVP